MKTTINEVIITSHCHATEDCNKVIKALKNLLPPGIRGRVEPRINSYRGYYGNIIRVLEIILKEPEATELLDYLGGKLGETDKSILDISLELRYDKRSNKLFIRLDKQAAYRDELVISDSDDVIKITISFKGRHKLNDVRDVLRKHGLVR